VFGLADWTRDGTLAEYVAVEARNLAPLPGDVDFTGGASLPLTLSICQTDAGANCLALPAPSVTTQIDAGATPTFSIFALGTGPIPFDPATNRIFVRFTDDGGVTRGATSVAVCSVPLCP